VVVKLPVASMIAVTTSFSGSIYTTALPTLLSTSAPTTSTTSSLRTTPLPTSTSVPQVAKQLSAGAGVGIGAAATLGIVLLVLALGYILSRRSRSKMVISHYGVKESYLGNEPEKGPPVEISSTERHELL
jgi:hypothetical protein